MLFEPTDRAPAPTWEVHVRYGGRFGIAGTFHVQSRSRAIAELRAIALAREAGARGDLYADTHGVDRRAHRIAGPVPIAPQRPGRPHRGPHRIRGPVGDIVIPPTPRKRGVPTV